ncbi:MAG: zinc-ribbon and DUF3426 domain-containing protein [Rhodoferax sp.]
MSLITRCPACGTCFKVVPDQLRVSEGWVRCGQCDEVFDGNAQLQGAALAAAPAAVSAPPQDAPVPADGQGAAAAGTAPLAQGPQEASSFPQSLPPDFSAAAELPLPDGSESASDAGLTATAEQGIAAAGPVEPVWQEWSGSDVAPDALVPPPQSLEDEAQGEPTAVAPPPTPSVPSAPPRGFAIPPIDTLEPQEPAAAQASFLQQGASGAVRRRRWPAALAAGVLSLALAGQALWHWRDTIGAHAPALAPLLAAACAELGCSLQPLRQIDALVIEGSGFVKVRSDVYRLSFSLRNNASVDLALPALELSLTDLREQALVRRVLTPSDYGAQGPVLAAGQEWSGVVPLSLKPGALGSERVSGYRLLVFYP